MEHSPALPVIPAQSSDPQEQEFEEVIEATGTDGKVLPFPSRTGQEKCPTMIAENEPKECPTMIAENELKERPTITAKKAGKKPRRDCPLPSIPGFVWEHKRRRREYECYLSNGRWNGEKKGKLLGSVHYDQLQTWIAEHGRSKTQLKPIVMAWIAKKRQTKGV